MAFAIEGTGSTLQVPTTVDKTAAGSADLTDQYTTNAPRNAPPPAPTTTYSTLRVGSTGSDVTKLQQTLTDMGYSLGTVDGIYGSKTAAAVAQYQKDQGLTVDSIAGRQTLGSLYSTTPTTTSQVSTGLGTGSAGDAAKIAEIERIASQPAPTGVQAPTSQNKSAMMMAEETGTTTTDTPIIRQRTPPGGTPTTGTGGQAGTVTTQGGVTTTGVPAPNTGGTSTGGTPTTGGGTTGGTATGGTTGGGTTTEPTITGGEDQGQQTAADIIAEIQGDQFVYDPATDESYQKAASDLENNVAQMMVGRGGLYSSVTNSALQSRLAALQIEYRQAAYDDFITERTFKLQLASFLADREDETFDRQMAIANYNMDVQQMQFSQAMQRANLQLSQARFAYAKQQDQLAQQQAQIGSILGSKISAYDSARSTYNDMMNKWKQNYSASADVASYFGVPVGSTYSTTAIARKASYLQTYKYEIDSLQSQYAEMGATMSDIQDLYAQTDNAVNVNSTPVNQLGTSQQQLNWASVNQKIQASGLNDAEIARDLLANKNEYIYGARTATPRANVSGYIGQTETGMGEYLWQKLFNEYSG